MRGMDPRQGTQTRVAARPGRSAALLLALLLAVGSAWAGPRLDREEREQLRRELRQQDRDRGGRQYQEADRGGYPRDGGWDRRGGWDPDRGPRREDRHRMAPEDREQLRHMLREHRRGRRD